MSDRRAKAKPGEDTEGASSQEGKPRASAPLHPSPPRREYYEQSQSSLSRQSYPPPSASRQSEQAYAPYGSRGLASAPLGPGGATYPLGQAPISARASSKKVTPEFPRQSGASSEYTSPPSAVRRRFTQTSPATSKSAAATTTKRSRQHGGKC